MGCGVWAVGWGPAGIPAPGCAGRCVPDGPQMWLVIWVSK
ncbi:hypothetical protein HMPREF0290_1328 [Corynebacterium efficiens YS-314]|nr:hypothetical protein HMPREF0290_1328 [Corynebacterium efficiens YS-314]